MTYFSHLKILLLILLFSLFFSCKKEAEKYMPSDYVCLFVNQGNFSQSNGSLSILTTQGTVENRVYEKVNGWKLGAIIESAVTYKNMLLLMCESEDKVEFVDKKSLVMLAPPVTGLGIPRYCAAYKDAAYVTCVNNWQNPDGKICKIDLESKKLVEKIDLGGTPEGIKEIGGLLYAAVDNGVVIIDPNNDSVIERVPMSESGLVAKHLVLDYRNRLWVSFVSESKTGVAYFDLSTRQVSPFFALAHMDLAGNMDITPDEKNILYLYAPEILSGSNPEIQTAVYTFNVEGEELNPKLLIEQVGMYGFNVNPSNGDIYTANVSGFTTNSLTYRYDAEGRRLNDGWLTGVATCRFVFP